MNVLLFSPKGIQDGYTWYFPELEAAITYDFNVDYHGEKEFYCEELLAWDTSTTNKDKIMSCGGENILISEGLSSKIKKFLEVLKTQKYIDIPLSYYPNISKDLAAQKRVANFLKSLIGENNEYGINFGEN